MNKNTKIYYPTNKTIFGKSIAGDDLRIRIFDYTKEEGGNNDCSENEAKMKYLRKIIAKTKWDR